MKAISFFSMRDALLRVIGVIEVIGVIGIMVCNFNRLDEYVNVLREVLWEVLWEVL